MPKLSFASIKARAKSYLRAATITYNVVEQKVRDLIGGYTECRRIRRASESCSACIDWSYRWMPIQDMPPIGTLQCGGRCRCYLEYR